MKKLGEETGISVDVYAPDTSMTRHARKLATLLIPIWSTEVDILSFQASSWLPHSQVDIHDYPNTS